MFKRRNGTTPAHVRDARGGVSLGAVVTGVVVALGAMFLLSTVIGGVLVSLDVDREALVPGQNIRAGIAAGVVFVLAQFLSYLWGGYTAGRMGRGAGLLNGALVPLLALAIGLLAAALVRLMGAEANLNLPFTANRLPLEDATAVEWGIGIGIASLAAMFIGGIAGGITGSRWHTKLESRVARAAPDAAAPPAPAPAPAPSPTAHGETAARSHPTGPARPGDPVGESSRGHR